ncbi:MAG: hypothetical protein IPL21_19595 [Saprospirales bacterium]|nr:hypothetical protein [Saprospirales bacterium]
MALELIATPIKRERNELNLDTLKAGFPAIQKSIMGLVLEAPLVNKIVFGQAKKWWINKRMATIQLLIEF